MVEEGYTLPKITIERVELPKLEDKLDERDSIYVKAMNILVCLNTNEFNVVCDYETTQRI